MTTGWYLTDCGLVPLVPSIASCRLDENRILGNALREHLAADVSEAHTPLDVLADNLTVCGAMCVGQQAKAEAILCRFVGMTPHSYRRNRSLRMNAQREDTSFHIISDHSSTTNNRLIQISVCCRFRTMEYAGKSNDLLPTQQSCIKPTMSVLMCVTLFQGRMICARDQLQ